MVVVCLIMYLTCVVWLCSIIAFYLPHVVDDSKKLFCFQRTEVEKFIFVNEVDFCLG